MQSSQKLRTSGALASEAAYSGDKTAASDVNQMERLEDLNSEANHQQVLAWRQELLIQHWFQNGLINSEAS